MGSPGMQNPEELEYVGFWSRCGAMLLDSTLLVVVLLPTLAFVFNLPYFDASIGVNPVSWSAHFTSRADSWLAHILLALFVLAFWHYKQSTPGKMLMNARIVDAKTGQKMSLAQALGRYLAYWVSALPCCLGFIWVAFDSKKQAWHDKLAGTVVVRPKQQRSVTEAETVQFEVSAQAPTKTYT
jgi:uncharacterized RDD family membrane protein YckC